jgi:hypothetical protein
MFLGSQVLSVHRADNLTAICNPIVYTVWDSEHDTNLLASMACYGNNFTFFTF